MADWFGQAIVGELVNRASSYLGGKYDLQSGINDKLARLVASLRRIRAAVDVAERRHIENPWLVEWLRELKDAAYEADDLLDVFEYRLLEQKLIADNEASSFAVTSRNAVKRLRTAATSLFTSDDDARALTSVVERLNVIASDVGEFHRLLGLDGGLKQPDVNSRRVTGSLLATQHRVFGREQEREQIIQLLLQSTPGGDENISVLPVLGIGGVGKTTLTQLVYNDGRVKHHFSLRMWVCVSDSFDVLTLTREILEQACPDKDGGTANFNTLQVNLQHKLTSERFLLVLDDVWNEEEKRQWETLCSPLKFAKEGSKILVTSRSEKVARLMGTMEPIILEGLQEEEFLSFFEERAFGCEDPGKHPKLAAIGKEIAKKLKGSPLAAKTVGGLLKANLDDEHWESILESRIWELQQSTDDITPVLKLSYDHLPTHLQRCFAYCSIFPKDWQIDPDNLIRLWMANGFIWYNDNGRKRMEDRGMDYFNDLVSRSFFQPYASDGTYVIHDLLHDLAESVSRDDCFRIEGDEPRTIPCTIRHLSLTNNCLATLTDQKPSVLKNLRTLLFFLKYKPTIDPVVLQNVFKEFKSIRVLSFATCSLERLPDTIDQLIHLRYLNIFNTGLRALPGQICRLYHLQYLGMVGLDLDSPPAKMNNLINLRHVTDSNGSTISKIAGIGKLTSLQRLQLFSVSKVNGFDIGQLKNQRELRSLCIENLENVELKEDAMEANLRDKRNLERLKLCWDASQGNVGPEVEEEVLEGLEPHPHLKNLAIVGCRSFRYPSWLLGLSSVVSLEMADHREQRNLAPLGQLPYLKRLKITGMHSLEEVGRGFYGTGEVKGFPSLEILEFRDMSNWREWSGVEDVSLFPRLRRLDITNCPKLMAMPSLPPNLETLKINGAGLIALPGLSGGYDNTGFEVLSPCPAAASSSSSSSSSPPPPPPSSLLCLFINNCPVLKSLGRGLLRQQHHLRNLRELAICSCEELESLPVRGLGKLISLTNLSINSCPKLMPLEPRMDREEVGQGRFFLPSSLKELEILECGFGDMHLSRLMQGLSHLTHLNIENCWYVTRLPTAEVLRQLTALQVLVIRNLEELTSVGGLGALVSIRTLVVTGCRKLTSALNMRTSLVHEEVEEERLSSLGRLYVDDPLLLKVLLTREGFASLQHLNIRGGGRSTRFSLQKLVEIFEQLTSLQYLFIVGWWNLWELPELKSLSSLKELGIWHCNNLQSLPRKEGLPALLEKLLIVNCHPVLKERYQHGDCCDWHTIAHIPRIIIR